MATSKLQRLQRDLKKTKEVRNGRNWDMKSWPYGVDWEISELIGVG